MIEFEGKHSFIFHLYLVGLLISIFLNGQEKLGSVDRKNWEGSRGLRPQLTFEITPRNIASHPFQQGTS